MAIDAALHSGSKTYFFSGGEYIRVTRGETGLGTVDEGYPKPLSEWGWPDGFATDRVDAALHSGPKTYFFSGGEYIRVTRGETGLGTVDEGYPKPLSEWGWPDGFAGVVNPPEETSIRVRKAVSSPEAATDIATYAAGVAAMRARSAADPDDPLGWEYFSRIHGNPFADGPFPGDPIDWSTCQHGTWFFVAWHRIYLRQLEFVIMAETGVDDFALPYWDYTDASDVTAIPAPFDDPASSLFDGTRQFRPRTIPAPTWQQAGTYAAFGGALQAVNHLGSQQGALELNPHNPIHGIVGGNMATFQSPLDPLFYIHHCNIDRFAAQWLELPGRANPTDTSWLDTAFSFPDPNTADGRTNIPVSAVATLADAGYEYDDVPAVAAPGPASPGFGIAGDEDTIEGMPGARKDDRLELLAATAAGGSVTDSVEIESPPELAAGLALDGDADDSPLYLVLENVGIDGGDASAMWDVFVTADGEPALVGTISPFGLAGLTAKGGRQTLTFDISHLAGSLGSGPIEVTFASAYADEQHEPYWERLALYTTAP